MFYLKKSLFASFFLIAFGVFHFLILPLFSSYEWVFGLNIQSGLQLLSLAALLIAAAYSFVIFASLSQDWRIGVGFSLLGALIPLAFSQESSTFVLSSFYFIALTGTYFSVENKMKKYYSFDPSMVLMPSIKTLCSLIAIIISIGFYLSMNPLINQKGFSVPESIIPDSLINSLIQQQTSQFIQGDKYIAQAQITPEMIQYAKEHPELLQQYGVTPDQLDQLQTQQTSKPASSGSVKPKAVQVPTTTSLTPSAAVPSLSTASIKKLALQPINNAIKDYQFLVAPILGLMLFSAFSFFFFFFFLFNVISGVILNIIFYILQKSGFIHFEKEMREVKKLVI